MYSHGGVEFMDVPLPEWRDTYRKLIDMGVDAVIASHPHVPQGIEYYKGKAICYSLGNFCFQKQGVLPSHWNESLCCVMDISDDGNMRMEVIPITYNQESQYIDVNHSQTYTTHQNRLNALLLDDRAYMEELERELNQLYPHYIGLFSRSGFLANFGKEFLKGLVEKFDKKHILNNINCESHRWAIARTLKSKFNL